MANKEQKDTVYVGTPLDADKHARLAALAKHGERKVAAVVRIAISEYIDKYWEEEG